MCSNWEDGFLSLNETLDDQKYVIEKYKFQTKDDPKKASAELAKEQSTALWKKDKKDLRPKYGAKVIEIRVLESNEKEDKKKSKTVLAKIAHPHINFGSKFPNLLSAIAGEGVFFCGSIDSIKLLDVEFPESYLNQFPGPKFGMKKLKEVLDIHDRPFFVGVVKPNIGLNPQEFAEIAYEGFLGGLDIAKDDEMLADVEYSPLEERIAEMQKIVEKAEAETGEKKLYLPNITDEVDNLLNHYEKVIESGGRL